MSNWGKSGEKAPALVPHCCAIFLSYLGGEISSSSATNYLHLWPFGSGGDPLGLCFSHLSVLQMANCIIIILATIIIETFLIIVYHHNLYHHHLRHHCRHSHHRNSIRIFTFDNISWLTYFTMERSRLIGKYFQLTRLFCFDFWP